MWPAVRLSAVCIARMAVVLMGMQCAHNMLKGLPTCVHLWQGCYWASPQFCMVMSWHVCLQSLTGDCVARLLGSLDYFCIRVTECMEHGINRLSCVPYSECVVAGCCPLAAADCEQCSIFQPWTRACVARLLVDIDFSTNRTPAWFAARLLVRFDQGTFALGCTEHVLSRCQCLVSVCFVTTACPCCFC